MDCVNCFECFSPTRLTFRATDIAGSEEEKGREHQTVTLVYLTLVRELHEQYGLYVAAHCSVETHRRPSWALQL